MSFASSLKMIMQKQKLSPTDLSNPDAEHDPSPPPFHYTKGVNYEQC